MSEKQNAFQAKNSYENPHQANAPKPMAIMIHEIVPVGLIKYAAVIRKMVWARKPEMKIKMS